MTGFNRHTKAVLFAIVALALAACAQTQTEAPTAIVKPDPLGDFKLGYAIVVTENTKKGPFSREMPNEVIGSALQAEFKRVFSAYEGKRFYHIGISVDGYVLAMPGIPIVASPQSALILTVNIWDDAKQKKIIEENKQFTILESFSAKTIFGSGFTQSKEEQLAGLTKVAVARIERWMRENEAAFTSEPPAPKS